MNFDYGTNLAQRWSTVQTYISSENRVFLVLTIHRCSIEHIYMHDLDD